MAFVSTRTNLATGITNTFGDVYVRDVDAGLTYRASVQVSTLLGSQAAAYRCFGAVLSADGQTVSFKASILGGSLAGKVWLFRQSLLNGVADVISTNALAVTWPSLSADGRYTAYDALNPAQAGVLVWDAWLQRSDPVIVPANTGPAHSPLLSSDGSTIALVSAATPNPSAAQPVPFQVYAGSRTGTNDRVFNLALITATPGGQPSLTDHEILIPALSPDGTRVAFESTDATLVPNDLNQASDVFLRDLQGQTTQLISRRDPALPARTSTVGLRAADPGCLSADARLLVTTTYDNNFAPDDTNLVAGLVLTDLGLGSNIFLTGTTNDFGWPRLSADGRFLVHGYACHYVLVNPYAPPPYSPVTSYYLRDLAAATSVLASVRYDGTGSAYGGYGPPAISPDGRWVAFASSDSGLVPGSYSTVVRTYARDMLAGTNQVLSRNQAGTFGNDLSADPVFSPDGHWVMFYSKAGNLSPYSPPGAEVNLYARNLDSDELRQISLTDSGTGSLGYLPPARFSVTGQFVVFGTVSNRIYVHDLAGRTNYAVGQGGANPAISASGRLVAAETVGPVPTQIILWDRQTGLSNLVSVNAAGSGGGNGPSTSPLLTANGRYVIFASRASDLVSDDDNGASDIFLRDLVQNVTMLVSRGLSGRPGRGSSLRPLLGPDGSTVVFSSVAPDLVAGDYNDARDVFVLKLGTADSDGDGMDDAWEMAYFGTLARDGTGDFDGDGMTDYQEFLAGTDPTNSNSVLRVFILSSVGNTNVTLLWPGSTNRAYRAQYKETVQPGPWTDLPGQPTVTGGTALQNDPTAPGTGQRFYRVVVGP